MFRLRALRYAMLSSCLVLAAIVIGGCLETRESILGRYDADKDQFVFLNLYQRIGGQNAADYDYLENLWKNRDHLITPPIPNILGKTSFLRISDKEFATLNLGNAAQVEISPSPLPLEQVTVQPGKFFLRGPEELCYYDQIIVPGKFIEATLKLLNQKGRENFDAAIAAERDRRVKGGALVTWAELRKVTVANIHKQNAAVEVKVEVKGDPAPKPDAAPPADPPASPDPIMVLSDASLAKLEKGLADGSAALSREKATFRAAIPLDENDAKEALATIAAIREAIAEELKKPDHDKDVENQASLLAVIESSSPRPGVIQLAVDATKLFPRVEAMMDPKAELPAPDGDQAAHAREAVAAIKAKNIPIDEKLTVQQIVADFHKGDLKGYPPEKSVPPGEGIVERK